MHYTDIFMYIARTVVVVAAVIIVFIFAFRSLGKIARLDLVHWNKGLKLSVHFYFIGRLLLLSSIWRNMPDVSEQLKGIVQAKIKFAQFSNYSKCSQ